MRFLFRTFLRGLSVVVPVVLTVWLVVWSVAKTESLLQSAFVSAFSDRLYRPGMGIVLGVLFVLAVGFLLRILFVQRFWHFFERQLDRLPIIKTVYDAFRDFFGFFTAKVASDASTVVLVEIGEGASLIGFVTEDETAKLPALPPMQDGGAVGDRLDDRVAVYLPMSYQLGGYTLLISREKLTELDWTVEKALRFVLTAGIGRRNESTETSTASTSRVSP